MIKMRPSEEALRVLTLLRLDAQRLFERIKYRELEYMQIFSAKRTREHFVDIFKNRYRNATIADLKNCGPEVIIGLDNFYSKIDDLQWYLGTTEDMPGTVHDNTRHYLSDIEQLHETLQLYINAEFELPKELSENLEE